MENISSFYQDYVNQVGNDAYDQGINLDGSGSYEYGTNAVYAVLFENNELWRVPYHVCFGYLNNLKHYHSGEPVAIFVQLQIPLCERQHFNADMQHTYYEWLFNHSPFRSVFVTKDYAKAIKDKVVVLDASAEANLMVAACSAIRLPWEYYYKEYKIPSIAKLWYELVSEGHHPDIAMALANNFTGSGDSWSFRGSTAGHQFLSVNDSATVINFPINNHIKTTAFNKLKGTDDYVGLCGIWEEETPKTSLLGYDVKAWLRRRIEGVSGKVVNPFGKAQPSTSFKLPALKEGLGVAAKELKEALHV